MLILVRWIPFLLGLGFIANAIQGQWAFSPDKPHPSPLLIGLDGVLGVACLAWAWWLRRRRLQREAMRSLRDQWAAYGLERYAQWTSPASDDTS
jgi:hypothetical protein